MKKSLALFLVLLACLLSATALANHSDDAKSSTLFLTNCGLINGTDKGYELDKTLTRAEAATIICRLSGLSKGDELIFNVTGHHFSDMENHWAKNHVEALYENGLVNGTGDDVFSPDKTVTAKEFAKMMLSVLGCKDVTVENVEKKLTEYKLDDEEIEKLISDNVTLTRGDAAIMCSQALDCKASGGKTLYDSLKHKGLISDNHHNYNDETYDATFDMTNAQSTTDFDDRLNSLMPSDKNYMFSPFSIRMAFGMVANGAKGQTFSEICKTLNITDIDKFNAQSKYLIDTYSEADVLTLEVANSIWQNTDAKDSAFSEDFKNKVSTFFNGTADTVNNSNAVSMINNWTNTKTHGKIPQIIDNPDFDQCIVNSVYFKGTWETQFTEEVTDKQDFTSRDGSVKKVDTMHKTDYFRYCENDGVQMLKLPYVRFGESEDELGRASYVFCNNLDVSMYVLLSDEKIQNPVSLVRNNSLSYSLVNLSLPKFNTQFSVGGKGELNEIMKKLGIKSVFDKNASDLTGMVEKGNSYVEESIHKTYISVDEEGTEAAAVTALETMGTSALLEPPKPIEMKVDKPFTYVIYDNKNDTVLFVGEYAFA